jgi:hypothetical protein
MSVVHGNYSHGRGVDLPADLWNYRVFVHFVYHGVVHGLIFEIVVVATIFL